MFTYRVTIESINQYGEREWKEEIVSNKSMAGARRKATNWINKYLFTGDCKEITIYLVFEGDFSGHEYWTLRINK